MTLPGGAADKLGNRYEKWWTLSQLVRMLQGETETLRIEVPGADKAEFVVTTGQRRELHQAKRDHPNEKWSLAALRNDGLLEAIGRQLRNNDDRFVFVSASRAGELANLCEAAKDAESMDEFQGKFLDARDRQTNFKRLLADWACDDAVAHAILRRIEVHTIDESELEQKVRLGLQALFLANPNQVLETLCAIVDDSVHRTISRQGLVNDLLGRGYRLRRLTSPQFAGAAVRAATDRYLSGARAGLIRQRLVPREATHELLSRLDGTAADCVLTGGAGSGKSACVVETVDALRARDTPVLAFRLDRFVSASTTADLGRLLDLEESPALVVAAAAEAAGCPGVLIIDQLDAVSTASGRSAGAFEIVEQLLAEARGTRPRAVIHVVVVCRDFDWSHDHHLRRLLPEKSGHVAVSVFTVEEVKTILADANFEPGGFRDRQLKILQLPQNLSLFLQTGFDAAHAPTFRTAKEIFDRYWDDKRRVIEESVPVAAGQWKDVMEILCGKMTSTQQLSVPKETLDAFSPGFVSQLASEGVLAFDGRRYGFGHESFFDYVFARLFVGRSEPLVALLKASEQHLFRRAQVRQVLTYLRESNADRYIDELRSLLTDDRIRSHLKDLVFALLADVTEPTEAEWVIWKEWIDPELGSIGKGAPNPDKLSALAWRRFFTSRSWFAEVDRRGLIASWLTSENDKLIDMAMNYFWFHQRHAPDRVAELLEPYADLGGDWARRIRSLMERAQQNTSRRFFDLFLHLIDNGALDDARDRFATNGTFWLMVYGMGEGCPEWVPEVVARRLRRRFSVIRAAGNDMGCRDLFEHDDTATEMICESSRRAPAAFVEHVLAVVLEISDTTAHGNTSPRRDAVWPAVILSDHPSGEDACISALAGVLATLARDGAPTLDEVIPALRSRETHLANHLLMALYSGGAERLADEAVKLLCDEPWRFQSGLFHYDDGCATAVIRAAVPHCAVQSRERLEEVVLRYVSPYERSADGYKQHGQTRLGLLSAFPEELRSARADRHLAELTRKFDEPARESRRIKATFVESPIDEASAERMTDDQWLRAIAKYRSEDMMDFSGEEPRGGALQLARTLGERVKKEPDRFARLGLRFPADANPVYLEQTLDALKGATISSELKLRVCRKAFEDSPAHCGRVIADIIGRIEDPLPDDAVRMLDGLAKEDDDPEAEAWQQDAGGGHKYYDGDILTNGINTTRGRAAEAIRALILRDAAYVERFRGTLDRMIQDPSAAVRALVAGALHAVAYRDPALGRSLFLDMDLSEERLLATHYVYHVILGSLRERLAESRPLVERMLLSSAPEVSQAGGRLAGISALLHGGTADLADDALHGNAHGRRGVAQAASANVANPEFRSWCEARLVALFDDADAEVRREAASCFRHLPDEFLGKYGDLIAAFCDSRAFEDSSFALMRALEHSRGRLPGTTCAVCEKFCERMAGDSRAGRMEHMVPKLVFRTYQQHQHDEWTSRALGLIDRLCLDGVPGAGGEFEQFER